MTGSVSVVAWLVGTRFDLFCGMAATKTETGPVIFCWLGGFDVMKRHDNVKVALGGMCRSAAIVEALEGASGVYESQASDCLLGIVKL